MRIDSDVDIDFGDRDKILLLIKHIPASMRNVSPMRKHATGVYITEIPYDPVNDMASLDYKEAEERGYFKLDLLNVHVYNQVKNEQHLIELMREPDWSMLNDKEFVEKLIHLGNQYDTLRKMPEPVNSITRLAMFLAVIRPAKRHLIGKTFKEINQTVWDKDQTGYAFKKSHAIAYAQLVTVHMNLLKENNGT
jgi:DNA polymerase III alpha subunit